MEKIPVRHVEPIDPAIMEQAEANALRINSKVDFSRLERVFNRALMLDVHPRVKLKRFLEAADEYCQAIKPMTACRHNCSYCCNIAATLTETEAELIGKFTGRKPKKLARRVDILANQSKYSGTPCPFLKKGSCSIYEVRPLACRIHFNVSDTPEFCNTNNPAQIPMINTGQIDEVFFKAFRGDIWADIRDFFPTK